MEDPRGSPSGFTTMAMVHEDRESLSALTIFNEETNSTLFSHVSKAIQKWYVLGTGRLRRLGVLKELYGEQNSKIWCPRFPGPGYLRKY